MELRKILLAGLIGTATALASSYQAAAQDPGVTDDEIRIGIFMPLSGPLTGFGVDPAYAARMWYEKVNSEGGIHGRQIRVLLEDDRCETNETLSIIAKFVSVDEVFLLNGGACTAGAQAAKEYISREQVPLVVMNAGADGGVFPPSRYFFAGSVGTQVSSGGAMMEFAKEHFNAERVAILVQDDDIGSANLRGARGTAEKHGLEVVAIERVSPRATDLTATMLNVRNANPDVILAILYPAPSALATQKYGEFAMTQPLVASVQAVPDPVIYAENVGNPEAFANFYYGTPLLPAEELEPWYEMFREAYPDRAGGPWVAFGIPSAMAITLALEKAGPDLTREKFVDAMESLNFESGALAGPTVYGPDRRDGFRSMAFNKFDGETIERVEGVFTWDGSISE